MRLCHALVMSALALLAAAPALAADSRVPKPVIEPARAGTQCIADPATMRRQHPAMLKHQRDDTVHGGIRGAKASLKACIDCHASTTTASVAKVETNFCVSCHSYAAVKIDCFECHNSKPRRVGDDFSASMLMASPAVPARAACCCGTRSNRSSPPRSCGN